MYLAICGLFRARWSVTVQDEWTRSLLHNRPDIQPQRILRTRALMDASIPDAVVTGHEPPISTLTLPDPDDRHVLAAAIHGDASVIVTANHRDFPTTALAPHHITAEEPDIFIQSLLDSDPHMAVAAFAIDRAGMTMPPMTVDEYLNALDRAGLASTAAALRAHIDGL
jgi:hypothetical protein